jgi:hypothetical protein
MTTTTTMERRWRMARSSFNSEMGRNEKEEEDELESEEEDDDEQDDGREEFGKEEFQFGDGTDEKSLGWT